MLIERDHEMAFVADVFNFSHLVYYGLAVFHERHSISGLEYNSAEI